MGRRASGRVTIVDVALEAGVSVSTVSRVLREHRDVDTSTRATVQAAIERLGYRPSPIARALVSGQTRLLALLVSDFTNPFYPQLAKSIEREADRAGYTVVISNTGDHPAEARRHLMRLLDQGLDGVIHAAVGRDEATVLALLGDRRRVVFTNRPPRRDDVSYVVSENFEGAAELTRHLLAIGHRRIGFIGGPPYAGNARERLRGFLAAMEGVAGAMPLVKEGDFSRLSGERAVLDWLDADASPTAAIAINDSVAIGAMEALMNRGLRIPDDMSLAGFDGTDLAASPIMSLTTVDQHSDALGRESVRILLAQLAAERFEPTQQVLPTRLLLRGSTEPPASRSTAPGEGADGWVEAQSGTSVLDGGARPA